MMLAWLVPGSHRVLDQIKSEGILEELESSGFKVREPGCSACLAMNDDKIPPGKYVLVPQTEILKEDKVQGQEQFLQVQQ